MTRPFLPKMLRALGEYPLTGPDGRYLYSLKEIGTRYGVSVPALSRAARKVGLSRYLTRRHPTA